MNRWLPSPRLSAVLCFLWLLLVNDFSLGQFLLGATFGLLVPIITRPFALQRPALQHPLKLVLFLLMVGRDIVLANIVVAGLILGPRRRLHPAFVEVPLDIRDGYVITILASIVSLTPGTVSADIDLQRGILLVHGLNVGDPQELIDEIKRRYEAPLKEIFGC
ncbi:MAG: Na+/H+ antiporter subunit E [Gammaproteobacteria bacterium HGW-Gammaproteobacteria-14]|nr:MAG: Na+/H+ antiporter subunit E [Gammaproteobacteria bacterium HGW-Gammaproteobacteria-14]